jgi:5-methylthioadenosine/S-adenosylhomocysteine deaminase
MVTEASTSSWLIAGARLCEDLAAGRLSDPMDVRLNGGRIVEITPAAGDPATDSAEVVDAAGMLLFPGLVNAHFHSTGTFNRAFVENLPLELFMLYELPPFDFGPFPAELYRTQVLRAASQMLKAGVTSVMDDAMFYPEPSDETVAGLMGAYRDCGIRATVAVYLPNKVEYEWIPRLKELLPADVVERMDGSAPAVDDLVGFYERFIERWHGTTDDRLRCALSCSAPQRASDDYMQRLHRLSEASDLPFVFHVYETKLQRVAADAFYGVSMIRHMRRLGVLDSRSIIVHAVWVDEADIADIAETGATVVHSPSGNLRCGSGVMPYRRLRSRGVPIALCTDEATVEDGCNLWQVGRLAGMLHTIGDPDYRTWPKPDEILEAMTITGGRCFGVDDLGTIRVGAPADVILLDLNAVLNTPIAKLANALVYGEDGSSVRSVFVAGRMVVRGGRLTMIDEDQLRRDLAYWSDRWAEALEPVERWAARLAPAYDEVYARCAQTDIGINRWVGNEGRWLTQGGAT